MMHYTSSIYAKVARKMYRREHYQISIVVRKSSGRIGIHVLLELRSELFHNETTVSQSWKNRLSHSLVLVAASILDPGAVHGGRRGRVDLVPRQIRLQAPPQLLGWSSIIAMDPAIIDFKLIFCSIKSFKAATGMDKSLIFWFPKNQSHSK